MATELREARERVKILVTGASGYLGANLCGALLQQGYSVRAFVRPTSDLSSLPPLDDGGLLELVYGDVTDYPSLVAACSGCHLIFHAAALVEPWLPDPSRFFLVNVGGLRNVLQAFKEAKTPQKIIYTSSFFALGPTDGFVADEKHIHHEKFFCTEYEKSKAAADKIALQAASDGVPIIAVYPGVVYGSGKLTAGNAVARIVRLWKFIHFSLELLLAYPVCDGDTTSCSVSVADLSAFVVADVFKQMIERFNGRLPGYIGYGSDKMSFSHVEDVVDGHIAAMHKGRLGERYLLTGENASFAHAFDVAAIITGTRRPWFHIPLWVLDAYGWISVLVARITGKLPLISYPTVKVLRHQWCYSYEKAKTELGYNPRSLKEGMQEVLPWLKSLGLIKY